MCTIWKPKVNELMEIFRNSMIDLIPSMEKAHIYWHQAKAYDDWDNINQALFKSIIVSAVKFSKEFDEATEMPGYDSIYDPMDKFVLIGIDLKNNLQQDKNFIFHSYITKNTPFDTVEYCQENENKIIRKRFYDINTEFNIDDIIKTTSFENVNFFLRKATESKKIYQLTLEDD